MKRIRYARNENISMMIYLHAASISAGSPSIIMSNALDAVVPSMPLVIEVSVLLDVLALLIVSTVIISDRPETQVFEEMMG